MIKNHAEIVGSRIKALCPDIPVYVKIPCSLCGKEHEEMVIDDHVSQPHLCEDCFRKIAEEWRKEHKED